MRVIKRRVAFFGHENYSIQPAIDFLVYENVSAYDIEIIINRRDEKLYKKCYNNMIRDIKGVGTFEFMREDIMRHPILIEITDRYEQEKNNGKLPKSHNS
jgi:hypothetical protein